MFIKGFDKFIEKIPVLRGKRIFLLPLYVLLVIWLISTVLSLFYSLPGLLMDKVTNHLELSLIPLLGFLFVELLGFSLFSQIWLWRDKLKRKYGQLAYQKIFIVGIAGVITNLTIAFNISSSFETYSPKFWQLKDVTLLVTPFESFFENNWLKFIYEVRIVLAFFLFVLSIFIAIRSISYFGIDYTAAVYVYFPEERMLQENAIYSVMRHPIYSGAIYFALGGFFYTFNIYTMIFLISFIICFYFHIHFIEEPELINQFGESYKEYRKKVPFLLINPLKLPAILKFLVNK